MKGLLLTADVRAALRFVHFLSYVGAVLDAEEQ